jgi:DNA-binding XRE family transcriptional regulator
MPRRNQAEEDPIFNRIGVLRAERGVSRQALAEAVGVHYQTIGYLERGAWHPSLGLALKIAKFFNLPMDAIFSDRPFEPMSNRLYGERNEEKK